MFTYIPEYNGLSETVYTDYRNEEEREFLTCLYSYAAIWEQYGLSDDDFIMFYEGNTVTLAFDICDNTANVVLRAMRIDFNETNLLLGEDLTMQYVCKLDVDDSEVKEYKKAEYSTKELAEIAAKWIANELSRKIELREWITLSHRHQHYVLVDTDKPLSWLDSENIKRWGLGKPKRVKIVHPSNDKT